MSSILSFFSPENIIVLGYLAIFGVVFAESGLLIGLFLPGDSLLFTAGFFAAQDSSGLSVIPLIAGCFIAAVTGDSFGYSFGARLGHRIFTKEESLFFSKSNIEKAKVFYETHGAKTIVLARFIPVVRTFAPILAGVGKMPYSKFLAYNLAGGALWTFLLIGGGYWLGNIEWLKDYVEYVILAIIFISVAPAASHILKTKLKSKN